ncbi:ankyrin repeat domain-containing protein [Streptomyces clavifer]|uniref:ankyrin repeat domain-containing protein n=1 Tax=Streptomyces clavifer TaxID=68188 RepID=UPI00380122C9
MSEVPDPEAVEPAAKLPGPARRGEAGALAVRLDAGAPAHPTDDRGDSLLMIAAHHGHAATVAALTGLGADPDRAHGRGRIPFAGAVLEGERDVTDALLAAGADRAAGTPSATDTARAFGKDDLLELFGAR